MFTHNSWIRVKLKVCCGEGQGLDKGLAVQKNASD